MRNVFVLTVVIFCVMVFFFLFSNLIMVKVKVSFTREQAVKAQKGVDE